MTVYVDSSALLKLFIAEPDSDDAYDLLVAGAPWVTAMHTFTEVGRVLGRALEGADLDAADARFREYWRRTITVELSHDVCRHAVSLARRTHTRTLDALHLAAAERAGAPSRDLPFVSYDRRQALAARSLGWDVRGVA